jgi:crotonobetainyl-CoA:carnitine CoA-transferase CaiB-like acyl-CoA transferase
MSRPLEGIYVLDLSRLLPGPYATQLLANMGAEVIKIERPPLGDYARAMPPYITLSEEHIEGSVFAQNNQGKKSIAVDLDQPDGQELVLQLCERADVFIESFRPRALARRGLDYTGVSARNPEIVYCSLSGYGQSGPYATRAGHDLNYLALAGILKLNGGKGQPPTLSPVLVADLAGGMQAALQICAALVARRSTGKGVYLDIGLFDAAVDWMQTITGALYRAEGENPRRGETPLTGDYPCYNIYETSDGEFMSLGALEPIFWNTFCMHCGRADLMDSQFDTAMVPQVAELFRERTQAEWTAFANQVDCCLEPLLDVSEVYAHPQVVARGLVRNDGRVPRLGEDTASVLREFGIKEQIK